MQRVAPGRSRAPGSGLVAFLDPPLRERLLHWELAGIDTRGRFHQDLARGRVPIPFPHRQVAPAHTLELRMPDSAHALHVAALARAPPTAPPSRRTLSITSCRPAILRTRGRHPRALVLRGPPANWARAEWSGGTGDRDKARAEDCCYGFGHGFFEWVLPLDGADLAKARRIRVLCEASSHRADSPQTDDGHLPHHAADVPE